MVKTKKSRSRAGCQKYLAIAGFLLILSVIGSLLSNKDERTQQPSEATLVPTVGNLSTEQPTLVITDVSMIVTPPTNTPMLTVTPPNETSPTPGSEATATGEPITWYVTSPQAINVRAQANTDSDVVIRLEPGTEVQVYEQVTGSNVNGSTLWYAIDISGQRAFAHSSLLSRIRPTSQLTLPVQNSVQSPSNGQSISTPIPADPFGCNQQDDLDCGNFRQFGINANAHLAMCGDEDNLDGDGDGRACER